MKIFQVIVCFTLLMIKPALCFEEAKPFENYLNKMKTLSGEFSQRDSRGRTATGTIQISRPGRMRLTYNPPSNLLMVADGKWLITCDREADQVDYVSLENTPAAFILRPNVKFSGKVEIVGMIPKVKTTEITLVQKDESEAGTITLVFQNDPIELKEWRLVDAQGVETQVILSNIKTNVSLPMKLFTFESPTLIQQVF